MRIMKNCGSGASESRIDDYWNIDGSRDLKQKPLEGHMWSGEETDKTASDIQARSVMARTLDEIGKKLQAEGEA